MLLREEGPYVASMLVDQMAELSLFDARIADELLRLVQVGQPLHLNRRIAQYCMARAIFLTITDGDTLNEGEQWIRQATKTLWEAGGRTLISEFLAGAKGAYLRTLRDCITTAFGSEEGRLPYPIFLDKLPSTNQWYPLIEHVRDSVADPEYYRRAGALFRELPQMSADERVELSQCIIRTVSKHIAQQTGIYTDWLELYEAVRQFPPQSVKSSEAIVQKLQVAIRILSKCQPVFGISRLSRLQTALERSAATTVRRSEEESIYQIVLWADPRSLVVFGHWCIAAIATQETGVSDGTINVDWRLSDDGSVSCTMRNSAGEKPGWTAENEKFMALHGGRKMPTHEGIGFVLPHGSVTHALQAEE